MAFDFDKSKTYLLACSFGPDSMALFNMLYEEKYKLVVCHVNYHTRAESNYEQESLQKWCAQRNVPLYVCDTSSMTVNGNFEAWARDVRYKFFKDIYLKVKAAGVFVAHQQDDMIETYIMQTNRKMLIPYYGIADETRILGMRVLRPLLNESKAGLLEYCKFHDVPYSIDSTNLEDDHTRNQIRHHIIEKMTADERREMLEKIHKMNTRREFEMTKAHSAFIDEKTIDISKLIEFEEEIQVLSIYRLCTNSSPIYGLSRKRINEVIKICKSTKPNIRLLIEGKYYFIKAYDRLCVKKYSEFQGYVYHLDKPGDLKTPLFDLHFKGDTTNRNIFDYDYPLTIRSFEPGDSIEIYGVNRKVRRLFIDWKMPESIRSKWPIFLNKDGKIVYIPRYIPHFKVPENSNLVIKI